MKKLTGTEYVCCSKCGGKGVLANCKLADGRCFQCNGLGRISVGRLFSFIRPKLSNPLTKKRVHWLIGATADDWSRVTADKMDAIERWVTTGPLAAWLTLPELGVMRQCEIFDETEKPF